MTERASWIMKARRGNSVLRLHTCDNFASVSGESEDHGVLYYCHHCETHFSAADTGDLPDAFQLITCTRTAQSTTIPLNCIINENIRYDKQCEKVQNTFCKHCQALRDAVIVCVNASDLVFTKTCLTCLRSCDDTNH